MSARAHVRVRETETETNRDRDRDKDKDKDKDRENRGRVRRVEIHLGRYAGSLLEHQDPNSGAHAQPWRDRERAERQRRS